MKRENIMVKNKEGRKGMKGGKFERIVIWIEWDEVKRNLVEMIEKNGVMIEKIGNGDGRKIMKRI